MFCNTITSAHVQFLPLSDLPWATIPDSAEKNRSLSANQMKLNAFANLRNNFEYRQAAICSCHEAKKSF